MNSQPFKDNVVLVTGASSGIGKSLAFQLASQGAKVVIAARRSNRLAQIAEDCRSLGGDILSVPTDVTIESECKKLIERCIDKYDRLDMLVNNAGLAVTALFEDYPDLSLFKHTLDVNFFGSVYCTYHALPFLKKAKGRLVFISSLGGKTALPYNTPYCSSKYGMQGFCDALRMELKPHAVSVTVICPWWVVTEFHEAQMDKTGTPRGKRGRTVYTKRMMTADQCARITLEAAFKRKREVLMGPGTLAVFLKAIAPGVLDWATYKFVLEPIIKRAKAGKVET